MKVYEYRVTRPRVEWADMRKIVMSFRDDDPMWQRWAATDEDITEAAADGVDLSGLAGTVGIAEATAREEEAKGARDVRIERREVGPWELMER